MGLVLCFRGFVFYSISPYAAESRHGSVVLTVGILCSIGRYAEESRHGVSFIFGQKVCFREVSRTSWEGCNVEKEKG
jgi:hypothetical protein